MQKKVWYYEKWVGRQASFSPRSSVKTINICLLSDPIIQGCTPDKIYSSGFPNPSYNSESDELFTLSFKGKDIILYNRHAVFEKGNQCIWFAYDGYWHMGNCKNLGGSSVYVLKKRNMECPESVDSWFSGNRNLVKSVATYGVNVINGPIACCSEIEPRTQSATASVTYQVRNGQYVEKCRWRKTCNGNWRCLKTSPRRRRC